MKRLVVILLLLTGCQTTPKKTPLRHYSHHVTHHPTISIQNEDDHPARRAIIKVLNTDYDD